MLIAGCTLQDGTTADVRIDGARVGAIGIFAPNPGERVIAARGGLLLPGLHDHHIHVAATAAALTSVRCGPPEVSTTSQLAAVLQQPGTGWLRATGYDDSVAGMLDTAMLDAIAPHRPIRIQHRSGRMWFFNSAGLDLLLAGTSPPPGLNRATGRLFDEDAWLKRALGSRPPSFAPVGAMLARRGVTGLTEISPANDAVIARHFIEERSSGALPQRVLLAGALSLAQAPLAPGIRLGPAKIHLHEAEFPPLEDTIAFIHAAHAQGRNIAVHCASEVELVFALAAIDAAGAEPGDRIEHASVAPDTAVAEIARLGLSVVTQPLFIRERGDQYRAQVEPELQPLLYRLRGFLDAGVPLAGSSDAPYAGTDPWESMAAAVSRQTRDGAYIGAHEALTPEQALDLYLADPETLGAQRRIEPGAPADLCLIDRGWSQARTALADVAVCATWVDGRMVFDGVDQPPVERGAGADPTA